MAKHNTSNSTKHASNRPVNKYVNDDTDNNLTDAEIMTGYTFDGEPIINGHIL